MDNVEKFKEEWEAATEISDNLTWAIFPVGNSEMEFRAAEKLMELFPNLEVFIYYGDKDEDEVIAMLEECIKKVKAQKAKSDLATAAEDSDYTMHLGVPDAG